MVPTFARWRAAGGNKTKNKTLPRGHPIIATNRVGDMGLGTEKSWQILPPWWPFSGLFGACGFRSPSRLQIPEITLFRAIKSHFRVINYRIIGVVERPPTHTHHTRRRFAPPDSEPSTDHSRFRANPVWTIQGSESPYSLPFPFAKTPCELNSYIIIIRKKNNDAQRSAVLAHLPVCAQ